MNNKTAYCVEYFYAKPGCKQRLADALLKIATLSRQESGCIQYDVLQDQENHALFIVVVHFSTVDTMKAHENQPYVIAFAEKDMPELCEKFFWNDAHALSPESS